MEHAAGATPKVSDVHEMEQAAKVVYMDPSDMDVDDAVLAESLPKRGRRELRISVSDANAYDDEEIGTLQNRSEILRAYRNDSVMHAAAVRGDGVVKNIEEASAINAPVVLLFRFSCFFQHSDNQAFGWHHHLMKIAATKIDERCPATLKRNLHNAVWMSQFNNFAAAYRLEWECSWRREQQPSGGLGGMEIVKEMLEVAVDALPTIPGDSVAFRGGHCHSAVDIDAGSRSVLTRSAASPMHVFSDMLDLGSARCACAAPAYNGSPRRTRWSHDA